MKDADGYVKLELREGVGDSDLRVLAVYLGHQGTDQDVTEEYVDGGEA